MDISIQLSSYLFSTVTLPLSVYLTALLIRLFNISTTLALSAYTFGVSNFILLIIGRFFSFASFSFPCIAISTSSLISTSSGSMTILFPSNLALLSNVLINFISLSTAILILFTYLLYASGSLSISPANFSSN